MKKVTSFNFFKLLKFLFLGLTLLTSFKNWGCQFKNNRQPIISFSGPITHLLFNLELLSSRNVSMISTFHGLSAREFKGVIQGGGLNIGKKIFQNIQIQNPIIFYDDSFEYRQFFNKLKKTLGPKTLTIGINTLGDPFSVWEESLIKLSPFLNEETCLAIKNKLTERVTGIKNNLGLSKETKIKPLVLFYLGVFKSNQRKPVFIMNNDSFVMTLMSYGKIFSYPSPLKYVSPSEKVISRWQKKHKQISWRIGLIQEDFSDDPVTKLYHYTWDVDANKRIINIKGRDLLIPGLPQIFFLENFLKHAPFF
jgi:hypothetical protein